MTSRDKLLLGTGVATAALLAAFGLYFVYVFIVGFLFELRPEAQSQGNWWLANGLSAGIERAIGPDAAAMLEQNCSPPMEGFAPAPECIFVRGTSGGPGCMRWDAHDGKCKVVQLRAGLLRDARVLSVIEEMSREYCHYVRPGDWATVPGCRSPGAEWRMHARVAPATLCVVASDEGGRNHLAFAIRDGRRIRDPWCERVWAVTRQ
jgi:hypothetical protein